MNATKVEKHCPFCGNTAETIQLKRYINGYYKIICTQCSATFEGFYTRREAIDKWNRRFR